MFEDEQDRGCRSWKQFPAHDSLSGDDSRVINGEMTLACTRPAGHDGPHGCEWGGGYEWPRKEGGPR